MERLGQYLRQAREAKGLSYAQIREATGIGEKFAKALEEDDHSVFLSEAEAKSYMRVYARYLGLEPQMARPAQDAPQARRVPSPEIPYRRAEPLTGPEMTAMEGSSPFIPLAIGLTFILMMGVLALAYLILFVA